MTESTRRDQTWVVGIDGSDHALHALEWATRHAPGRASRLRIVRAWSVPPTGTLEISPMTLADLRPAQAYDALDQVVEEMGANGIVVDADVVQGPAASVLLEASSDSDLLVIGSRGRGGFARLLLGSTSHQCATHARIPVVVVPAAIGDATPTERLVVGVDGSPGAEAALGWAFDFAGEGDLVTIVGAFHHPAWVATDLDLLNRERQSVYEAFVGCVEDVERGDGSLPRSERQFTDGHPAEALLGAADGAQLVVVGERGHRGLGAALLGSTATEMLHRAECPVAVVPVAGETE